VVRTGRPKVYQLSLFLPKARVLTEILLKKKKKFVFMFLTNKEMTAPSKHRNHKANRTPKKVNTELLNHVIL
jgi:hypothetical protein